METMEWCWSLVYYVTGIISLIAEGWIFAIFVRPFINRRKSAWIAGIVYSIVMIGLYVIPMEVDYPRMVVSCVELFLLWLLDKRNVAQKFVLVVIMYLFNWIAHGIALIPRNMGYAVLLDNSYLSEREALQLAGYIILEVLFYIVKGLLLYLLAVGIHKVYINKRENINRKELMLLLCVLLAILTGYFAFTYLSEIYVNDMGQYIWNIHDEYTVLKVVYQIFSGLVLFIVIAVYQKINEKQREEKENAVLEEQMESMKSHISEVEKLYGDIRALKHEMGNHITVLENLVFQNQQEETEKYFSELKENWRESVSEIQTGNPVTDVILMQKKKEIEEKGICFTCDFHYPAETRLEAFDVSIILNNALVNAMEGVAGCNNPYISITSYRNKNAYMIEVKNSIKKKVILNEETGLPDTTKKDKVNHGFGLTGIRRTAQKYFGEIDIEQDRDNFLLSIMLMVE